ncbi:uncharacterized protein AMSG_05079 [Thecamonas trahens ATCC 50062]|uniref:Calcium uniporter protein C-terminal domain-containing protein n=1 Tax=Thecamonas trahens ATCC 50062 TaxID=461836 RepID=A0A0L0DA59_THETB|nr:hypothetical protein AMSG_05079 [Thecamonas trahens ATCC 50062]KNC49110.1 hypothetical protein AMSG_05079 [Thecamonas trahens ATCC 50062]|eukprot:XP_013758138.1 hypothetical protein AMSG_05079 [Thecamonas trahens ATCC 50062]
MGLLGQPQAPAASAAAKAAVDLVLDGSPGAPPAARMVVPLSSGPVSFHLGAGDTVASLVDSLVANDPSLSVDDVVLRSPSGVALAGSTPWASVLRESSVAAGAPLQLELSGEVHSLVPSYDGTKARLGGSLDITQLLKKEDFAAVAKALRRDTRSAMPKQEFVELCEKYEIDELEAEFLARSLAGCGSILYFYDEPNLASTLFIKPRRVFKQLHRTLNVMTPNEIAAANPKTELLASMEAEIEPLTEIKSTIESKSAASASRMMFLGFAGVVAQLGIITRLTWWEFSWDIMEPVSYVVMIGQAVLLYGFYNVTSADPDSYEGLRGYFYDRKYKALCRKLDFDPDHYDSLVAAYERLQYGSPRTRAEEKAREMAEDVARRLLAENGIASDFDHDVADEPKPTPAA